MLPSPPGKASSLPRYIRSRRSNQERPMTRAEIAATIEEALVLANDTLQNNQSVLDDGNVDCTQTTSSPNTVQNFPSSSPLSSASPTLPLSPTQTTDDAASRVQVAQHHVLNTTEETEETQSADNTVMQIPAIATENEMAEISAGEDGSSPDVDQKHRLPEQ